LPLRRHIRDDTRLACLFAIVFFRPCPLRGQRGTRHGLLFSLALFFLRFPGFAGPVNLCESVLPTICMSRWDRWESPRGGFCQGLGAAAERCGVCGGRRAGGPRCAVPRSLRHGVARLLARSPQRRRRSSCPQALANLAEFPRIPRRWQIHRPLAPFCCFAFVAFLSVLASFWPLLACPLPWSRRVPRGSFVDNAGFARLRGCVFAPPTLACLATFPRARTRCPLLCFSPLPDPGLADRRIGASGPRFFEESLFACLAQNAWCRRWGFEERGLAPNASVLLARRAGPRYARPPPIPDPDLADRRIGASGPRFFEESLFACLAQNTWRRRRGFEERCLRRARSTAPSGYDGQAPATQGRPRAEAAAAGGAKPAAVACAQATAEGPTAAVKRLCWPVGGGVGEAHCLPPVGTARATEAGGAPMETPGTFRRAVAGWGRKAAVLFAAFLPQTTERPACAAPCLSDAI